MAVAGTAAIAGAGWAYLDHVLRPQESHHPSDLSLGCPGPYPSRVVEIHNPAVLVGSTPSPPEVQRMMATGMQKLVGSDDDVEAWRRFFQPGDRVGIAVPPLAQAGARAPVALLYAVISGLKSAGVRLSDILVFGRFKSEFIQAGYPQIVPWGIHWECSSAMPEPEQLELDGQLPRRMRRARESRVAGYDPDHYRELQFCAPEHDPTDDRRYRSHVSRIVTQKVDKVVSLPELRDDPCAGVALSLQYLACSLVNNVARRYVSPRASNGYQAVNNCGTFIPAIVSLEAIRGKTVLHILDGLLGAYDGSPSQGGKTPATWEQKSLFFATDPVAVDHVGLHVIDEQRQANNLPLIAGDRLPNIVQLAKNQSSASSRIRHLQQPEHIFLAGRLGLGTWDINHLEYQRLEISSNG